MAARSNGPMSVTDGWRSESRCRALLHRLVIGAALFAAALLTVTVVGAPRSTADVGDLGAPPADVEIQQVFTDFYNAGHPPDATVDVRVVGPAVVGKPTMHPNPPPQPWCVRCGYPDQGSSLMYPVLALVTVTVTQGLEASALPESSVRHTTTTSYDGTPCPGPTVAQYCPSYFFYRDGGGRWQVA